MDKDIRMIMSLLEDVGTPGTTSILSGGSMAQMAMDQASTDQQQISDSIGGSEGDYQEQPFTAIELKLTARFIELVGGFDRACDLIKKIKEVQNVLDVDEESETIESNRIDAVADLMPSDVDLPTKQDPGTFTVASNFSSLYNPNAGMR